MNSNSTNVNETINKLALKALEYTGTLNRFFSVLTYPLAIACVGTENPQFYASMSIVFIYLLSADTIQPYRKIFDILRVAKHPDMKPINAIKRSLPIIFGWAFLGFVAAGAIDKTGWVGLPSLSSVVKHHSSVDSCN